MQLRLKSGAWELITWSYRPERRTHDRTQCVWQHILVLLLHTVSKQDEGLVCLAADRNYIETTSTLVRCLFMYVLTHFLSLCPLKDKVK